MLGRLFRIKNRTAIYDRAHKITATFLIGFSGLAFLGVCHQLYKAKTEYLPEIRRRGKERLETTLAVRQSQAELVEQQRLAEKQLETNTKIQ
jgi:Zn-dependent oligopeptidase